MLRCPGDELVFKVDATNDMGLLSVCSTNKQQLQQIKLNCDGGKHVVENHISSTLVFGKVMQLGRGSTSEKDCSCLLKRLNRIHCGEQSNLNRVQTLHGACTVIQAATAVGKLISKA